MATEGKAIIFYRCNFFSYFVSIDERPAMDLNQTWPSRSEVVLIYLHATPYCPPHFVGPGIAHGAVCYWLFLSVDQIIHQKLYRTTL